MSLFLTSKELSELTGLVRRSAQIRWLRANGITVVVRADGKPVVSRAAVESKLGGDHQRTAPEEPDWSALEKAS